MIGEPIYTEISGTTWLLGVCRQLIYRIRQLVHMIPAIRHVGWQVKSMIIQKVKCTGIGFLQVRLVTNLSLIHI